jgi:GT2 family glycosyltransferase
MSEALVDVLVPTCNRPCALAVTLTALSAQSFTSMRIIVSDQSDGESLFANKEVAAVLRYLKAIGRELAVHRHLPRRGMAEQRAFLLSQASAPYCLFLDDDVIVEPDLVERLYRTITRQGCGFVGSALHGLSFLDDERPHQQHIEFWETQVRPETVVPTGETWARHHLHSAANLFHVQARLGLDKQRERLYRVAWIGGCVMFDTAKLRSAGGFDFWQELPPEHCGEDVLAQLRVMERYGGCGLIPSGAYHMEVPTTIPVREIDAPKVLHVSSGSGNSVAEAGGTHA